MILFQRGLSGQVMGRLASAFDGDDAGSKIKAVACVVVEKQSGKVPSRDRTHDRICCDSDEMRECANVKVGMARKCAE